MSDDPELDRTLHDAFVARHVPVVARPSMIDVQHRARRRTQRRAGAMLGCTALVAAGSAAVWAARHEGGRATATVGDGGAQFEASTTVACAPAGTVVPATVPSTTAFNTLPPDATSTLPPGLAGTTTVLLPATEPCFPVQWSWHCTGNLGTDEFGRDVYESCEQVPAVSPTTALIVDPNIQTTVPGVQPTVSTVEVVNSVTTSTISLLQYEIQAGDTPPSVASRFGITVDELNAANAGLPGYDKFYATLVILIPSPGQFASTTTSLG